MRTIQHCMVILRLYISIKDYLRKNKVFCLEVTDSLEENFSEDCKYIADYQHRNKTSHTIWGANRAEKQVLYSIFVISYSIKTEVTTLDHRKYFWCFTACSPV